MTTAKYAGLPDIDTAQDVYETPDTFTLSHQDGNSSDDDSALQRGSGFRARNGAGDVGLASGEELDSSSFIGTEAAVKHFRKAEKRREHRQRLTYAYPPSPTSDDGVSPARPPPLPERLRALQHEVASLEAELSDPSNPLLHANSGEMVDAGVLMKGLVDVRGRLEKFIKVNDGRGRLVERVLKEEASTKLEVPDHKEDKEKMPVPQDTAAIDRRLGNLEKLVGSPGTTLDESSPLPPPLLPLITRLSNQLTILTQPRHIDSISRRLKLLLSDLERASTSHSSQGRRQSQPTQIPPVVSPLQDSLQPVLARLAPVLPHIPHILTRLRTLSALHTNASAFQDTLEGIEEEQKRVRIALEELESAVQRVEKSLKDNTRVTASNISGLETRVEDLGKRMERMDGP